MKTKTECLTYWINDFDKWSDEVYCMEAVKKNGMFLKYVKNQTEEMRMEAVKENGDALQYAKNQTEAVCLAAVKEDERALHYIRDREMLIKVLDRMGIK